MKKLFILGAFLLTGSMVYAQLDQGTVRLGIDLGFSTTSNNVNDNKFSSLNFGPEVGYFIADELEVIAGINYNSSSSEVASIESKNSGLGVNLGIRKYFAVIDNFAPWAGFGIGFGSGKTETGAVTTAETSNLNIGLIVGASYFVTDNIGITASLGGLSYNSNTNKAIGPGTDFKSNTIALDFTKNISFGVSYYFH